MVEACHPGEQPRGSQGVSPRNHVFPAFHKACMAQACHSGGHFASFPPSIPTSNLWVPALASDNVPFFLCALPPYSRKTSGSAPFHFPRIQFLSPANLPPTNAFQHFPSALFAFHAFPAANPPKNLQKALDIPLIMWDYPLRRAGCSLTYRQNPGPLRRARRQPNTGRGADSAATGAVIVNVNGVKLSLPSVALTKERAGLPIS